MTPTLPSRDPTHYPQNLPWQARSALAAFSRPLLLIMLATEVTEPRQVFCFSTLFFVFPPKTFNPRNCLGVILEVSPCRRTLDEAPYLLSLPVSVFHRLPRTVRGKASGARTVQTARIGALCFCISLAEWSGRPGAALARRAPAAGLAAMSPKVASAALMRSDAGAKKRKASTSPASDTRRSGRARVARGGTVAVPASAESCTPPTIKWFEDMYNGAMSDDYKRYMVNEWGHEKRGDVPLFEKLCLEGAQAGLSWATILAKREVCMCVCARSRCACAHGAYVTHMLHRDTDKPFMASIWSAVLQCLVAISNRC